MRRRHRLWLKTAIVFMFVAGGLHALDAYLLRRRVAPGVLKEVVGIHLLVFGCMFAVMLALTFSPPIVLTGLIAVFLLLACLTIPAEPAMA